MKTDWIAKRKPNPNKTWEGDIPSYSPAYAGRKPKCWKVPIIRES